MNRNHSLYEVTVTYVSVQYRKPTLGGMDSERLETPIRRDRTETLRIVAPSQGVAEATAHDMLSTNEHVKIVNCAEVHIDAFVERHAY